jgi:hypothetical protein
MNPGEPAPLKPLIQSCQRLLLRFGCCFLVGEPVRGVQALERLTQSRVHVLMRSSGNVLRPSWRTYPVACQTDIRGGPGRGTTQGALAPRPSIITRSRHQRFLSMHLKPLLLAVMLRSVMASASP